jgi:hypothetical protein
MLEHAWLPLIMLSLGLKIKLIVLRPVVKVL